MNLEDALSTPPQPEDTKRFKPAIPKAGEPGTYEWDGTVGVINTQPTEERVTNWDSYLIDAGLDPEFVEVIEPVNVRGWDANAGAGEIIKMHYYSLRVQTRRPGPVIDDLLANIKVSPKVKSTPFVADGSTFVVALADGQLGKIDGDGIEGTTDRIIACIDQAAEQLQYISKYTEIENVHVAWLGDMVEGFVSQGGANSWRTQLPLTEQIRILRRLMLYSVETFYPLSPKMSVIGIPGNHDEPYRVQGKGATIHSESHDVDSLIAVADACKLAGRFENVSFYTPERDEMTVTLETSNTVITHVHGHKFKSGAAGDMAWWKGQSFGDFAPGNADIMLSGHVHHLQIAQSSGRTSIRVPALEAESTYYRHSTGETGNPGIVTLLVKDTHLKSISVLNGK